MTRRLIVVLVFLLPLRAWAGDWMAITMLQSQSHEPAVAAMPVDCPGHVGTGEQLIDETEDCCDTCELCLPLTRLSPLAATFQSSAPSTVVAGRGILFLSVDLTPARKPPRP